MFSEAVISLLPPASPSMSFLPLFLGEKIHTEKHGSGLLKIKGKEGTALRSVNYLRGCIFGSAMLMYGDRNIRKASGSLLN